MKIIIVRGIAICLCDKRVNTSLYTQCFLYTSKYYMIEHMLSSQGYDAK